MSTKVRTKIEKNIDILEDDIVAISPSLLKILLQDKTTKNNILWCTKDYEYLGSEFEEHKEIKAELITGDYYNIIQPRAAKSKKVRENRIKKRAEVFTPSWVCNKQNNQIDENWFGKSGVFNKPRGKGWNTNNKKIVFNDGKKDWKSYVDSKRLEITCGEAPYLVSRYDTTTGNLIPLYNRIGLFDRKMRVVEENCKNNKMWIEWSIRAIKSVYGYELQGDSVLVARENLLFDYIDYYVGHFNKKPPINLLKKIANIISWNIWQMDGFKYVVPYSCHEIEEEDHQLSFFDKNDKKKVCCPGCRKNNIFEHNGIYCRIFDWTNLKKSIPFISVIKEEEKYGKV